VGLLHRGPEDLTSDQFVDTLHPLENLPHSVSNRRIDNFPQTCNRGVFVDVFVAVDFGTDDDDDVGPACSVGSALAFDGSAAVVVFVVDSAVAAVEIAGSALQHSVVVERPPNVPLVVRPCLES